MPHVRRPDSARYVGGLLLWQGAAWLVLAAAGLGVWIAALQDALSQGVSGSDVLWRGGELLAIAVGAGLGAAEVGMACRLRAGPRLLLVLTLGLQGAALAAGLVVIAISVIVAAFVLEVLALNGAFLGRRQQDRPRDSAYRSHWAGPVLGCGYVGFAMNDDPDSGCRAGQLSGPAVG